MKKDSKSPFLIVGLAIAGIAGYLYFKSPQKVTEMGSNYGSGGSSDFYGQPTVNGVDSTVAGIEDTLTTANIGSVDVNDSADKNMFDVISRLSTEQQTVDNVGDEPILTSSDITELAAYGGLAGSGFIANRALKSTALKSAASGALSYGTKGTIARVATGAAKVTSRAVPVIGTALMFKDVADVTGMTADAYGGTVPSYQDTITSNWNGLLNTLGIKDSEGKSFPTLAKPGQKTGNILTPSNAVNASDDVKNNVGVTNESYDKKDKKVK